MPSKAYKRFEDRVRAYDGDLELADALVHRFLSIENTNSSVCDVLGSTAAKHPILATRTNSKKSREILGVHLKSTLYSSFIKEIYEDFSEYIATSLARAALAGVDAARFAGEVKLDLHASEILKSGSWENVIKLISDKIFRALENEKSTKVLITKISARIGLQIEDNVLSAAMPYLDGRHLLVHRDGQADDFYIKTYPDIPLKGTRILVNYDFVREARSKIKALAEHIDTRLGDAGLIRKQDMAGQLAA